MKYYKVKMIHPNIKDVKTDTTLPPGYHFRYYREGDEKIWAYIEAEAGEFKDESLALNRFESEFGENKADLKERCFFLCHEEAGPIGTSMAWYDLDFKGEEYGRLHWVAIHPDFQGKKLARPLIAKAIEKLQLLHDKAYLTSQTTSWIAIKIYLDFGFTPLLESVDCREAWRLLALKLNHPALVKFR